MTSATDTSAEAPRMLYRLVFSGELLSGFDEAQVRSALTRRLKRSPASLFSGKRVTVGEYPDPAQADTERRTLQSLGARIHLEEVEAPPPMPALGFLEVALPVAQAAEPQVTEKFAKTDSGWQPLSDRPIPLHPVDDDLLSSLNAVRVEREKQNPNSQPDSTNGPAGRAMSSVPARPPTDLSAVFSTSTATPAPVVEASKLFAPTVKTSVASEAGPLSRTGLSGAPEPSAMPVPDAVVIAEIAQMEASDADWIACPACGECQPMQVLCRACRADLKRALAARQEAWAQTRAAGGRGSSVTKIPSAAPATQDAAARIVRFRDEWLARLTWPHALMALFGFLLLLAAVGFFWRLFGLDPIFMSSSKPTPKVVVPAASESSPVANVAPGDQAASGVGPTPLETEVASRLPSAAAVAEFRQRYWQQPTSKVFVYSSGSIMAWRAGSPSVTRAIAEAMNECESRRSASAPPCKLVNVNNYWQN